MAIRNEFDVLADLLIPPNTKYRNDPVRWAKERVAVDLWSKQRAIVESVRDHKLTAVRSCNTVGKSFGAAAVSCWWLDTHPLGSARVLTTAPTGGQVRDILWSEIKALHKAGNLPGRTNQTEWLIGEYVAGIGRKPSDYSDAVFSGYHARYMLVILDEAGGIPRSLWDAVDTLTNNEGSKILAIGNPNNPQSRFAEVCQPGSGWNAIHISTFDSPNLTGEDVSPKIRDSLVSAAYPVAIERSHGKRSAFYAISVLGEFPVDTEDGIVPWSMAAACRSLEPSPETPGSPLSAAEVVAGLDIAVSGDRAVLRARRGTMAWHEEIVNNPNNDSMQSVGTVVLKLNEWGVSRLKVETDGLGKPVYDRLKELGKEGAHNAEVIPVQIGSGSREPKRFLNLRAELWWEVGRENSRLQRWDLSNVDDETLAELTAPRYEVLDSNGKLKVEPKAQVQARLGRSPDRADALLLAYYEPFSPAKVANLNQYAGTIG